MQKKINQRKRVLYPIDQQFGPKPTPRNKLGCVLIFKQEVREFEAKKALEEISKLLEKMPDLHKFDANVSSPVFYIP